MAKVGTIALKTNSVKQLCRCLIFFLTLVTPHLAFADDFGTEPWRPAKPLRQLSEPNASKATELIQKLCYSDADKNRLFDILVNLPHQEATAFLKKYVRTYLKESKLTDIGWASAIFCLGLVQTEDAKAELLRLWDVYDQQLARGQIKVKLSDMHKSYPPLKVIGELSHFFWVNHEKL